MGIDHPHIATTKQPRALNRFIPITAWLPQYQRSWLRKDVIAGLSVWALMVPTSLGYAALSGVPVQNGLYAATIGMFVFALFTTSKQVVQGPGSSTAPVLGAAVVSITAAGSENAVAIATAVVLVAGLLFVVLAVLKLGWVSKFLSAAVLTGFIFGVAINVVSGELFKVTGTEKSGSNTWQKLGHWGSSVPDAKTTTVVVGVAALVLLFGLKLLAPKVPAALMAVVLGIVATKVFNLGDHGVELIPEVPRGLPKPSIPDVHLIIDNWETVIGAAVGLVLIGFSVTTAAVRQYATKHNYRIDIAPPAADPNRVDHEADRRHLEHGRRGLHRHRGSQCPQGDCPGRHRQRHRSTPGPGEAPGHRRARA